MSKKRKNNLVALGSAAVLTIYAAGYVRTQAAAQLFAQETGARRPAAEPSRGEQPAAPSGAGAISPIGAATGAAGAAGAASAAPPATGQPATSATGTPGATQSHASTPAFAPSGTSKQAARSDSSASVGKATVPVAPTNGPSGTNNSPNSTPPALAAAADSTPSAPQGERGQYKDGTYFGWGTSRHGDIQASVEIRDGHIFAARIAQCLTRYSCSWIWHLQAQVALRQSPEVDYVSGATQSANAFYYAVVEALKLAR